MNPLSLWPVVIVYGLVLAIAALLAKRVAVPPADGRFSTLDGLRGFLAFGVFIHHGAVWYFYLRTGAWEHPESVFYANLGQDSVALFFMITGFLFWTKLLDGRTRDFDWTRLYASRVLRLTPLYFFTMAVGGLMLAIAMHFQLLEPARRVAVEAVRWLSFTILGTPPVNGSKEAFVVIAGVTWTLPYEWLFYCALPLAAPLLGVRARWPLLVGALLVTAGMIHYVKPETVYLACFGGGIFTAYLVRSPVFRARARAPYAAVFAVAALGAAMFLFSTLQSPALILLTTAFAIITAGNTLGGLLAWPAARLAGEITYSVYLLHGLVLFAVFHFLLGTERAASFTAFQHWLVIFACVPLTVLVCCLTFRWIEAPAMQRSTKVSLWIHQHVLNRR